MPKLESYNGFITSTKHHLQYDEIINLVHNDAEKVFIKYHLDIKNLVLIKTYFTK